VRPVEVIAPKELGEPLLARWRAIQAADATLDSPFLAPEFTLAVARVRPDVWIAVVREGREPAAAFLPVQYDARGDGVPIGYPFSDRGGLIAPPGLELRAEQIAEACGLRRLHFRGVPAQQEAFQPHVDALRSSPAVEIARARPRPHEARRYRKLERDFGPLRFEPELRSQAVLATLLEWKRTRAARSGLGDPFRPRWIRELLAALIEEKSPGLAAPLSALYAGDRLVAAQLGPRSAATWHWWIPSYERELAAYSPGLVLLLEMLGHAPRAGVSLLDFGTGPERFKRRFCTTLLPLVRGCVIPGARDRRSWRLRRAVRGAVAGSRVERLARNLAGRKTAPPED
jgi:CelD/BcsL family acetyltransferase involved in cellulose biosynthesis